MLPGNDDPRATTIGVLDPNEKRQKAGERYATMSKEKKDELNRMRHERRMDQSIHTTFTTTRESQPFSLPADLDLLCAF